MYRLHSVSSPHTDLHDKKPAELNGSPDIIFATSADHVVAFHRHGGRWMAALCGARPGGPIQSELRADSYPGFRHCPGRKESEETIDLDLDRYRRRGRACGG